MFKFNFPYISFSRFSKQSLITTACLIVLSFLIIFIRGFNFGLEFTGGATIEMQFKNAADIPAIREQISTVHKTANAIQYGSSTEVQISFGEIEGQDTDELMQKITQAVQAKWSDARLTSQSKIGGQYREELIEKGLTALIISCIGMMIYLSIRFEWKFSVAAVVADLQNCILVAGIFALFQWTFDLTVLAALMAILGYSINDTVVLFDRVRENILLLQDKKIEEIIDISINQTMARTVVTSLTTAFSVIALLFLGGESLFGFAVAMIIGIFIGTCSSVFVATSLVKHLNLQPIDLMPKTKEQLDDLP